MLKPVAYASYSFDYSLRPHAALYSALLFAQNFSKNQYVNPEHAKIFNSLVKAGAIALQEIETNSTYFQSSHQPTAKVGEEEGGKEQHQQQKQVAPKTPQELFEFILTRVTSKPINSTEYLKVLPVYVKPDYGFVDTPEGTLLDDLPYSNHWLERIFGADTILGDVFILLIGGRVQTLHFKGNALWDFYDPNPTNKDDTLKYTEENLLHHPNNSVVVSGFSIPFDIISDRLGSLFAYHRSTTPIKGFLYKINLHSLKELVKDSQYLEYLVTIRKNSFYRSPLNGIRSIGAQLGSRKVSKHEEGGEGQDTLDNVNNSLCEDVFMNCFKDINNQTDVLILFSKWILILFFFIVMTRWLSL